MKPTALIAKAGLVPVALALCALPAQGGDSLLSARAIDALSSRDSLPTKDELDEVFMSPQLALEGLRQIALDRSIDLGVALRAIRVLPAYCPPEPEDCGPGAVAHDTLHLLIEQNSAVLIGEADQLRLRAAIEALGTTRSGLVIDVEKLDPLLDNTSRDIRAAVVRALRGICNREAITRLSLRFQDETSAQVKHAINAALRDLRQCN